MTELLLTLIDGVVVLIVTLFVLFAKKLPTFPPDRASCHLQSDPAKTGGGAQKPAADFLEREERKSDG